MIPDYLKEGLPNPDIMPVKIMISKIPEKAERPPPVTFDKILKELYQEKLLSDRAKLIKQSYKKKPKLKKLKIINKI